MKKTAKAIHVVINKVKYTLENSKQTGARLKELAGIPPCDDLFLEGRCGDQLIANDAKVVLRNCDQLHSQPPANYGSTSGTAVELGLSGDQYTLHDQPDGWTFVVIPEFSLPPPYLPRAAKLLVKLPPLFPEAAPDMFWVRPAVRLENGCLPRNTTTERLLGDDWQRFSWHLVDGTWKPGVSTFRDFLRSIRGRLSRGD